MKKPCLVLAFLMVFVVGTPPSRAQQQVIPPGQFIIGGIPVACGMLPTVIQQMPPQSGYAWFGGQAIIVNWTAFGTQHPFLQLFIYAHECGHFFRGPSEDWADCFAAKLGRNQGWFPPQNFQLLMMQLGQAPGDWTHKPGPQRLQNIAFCYQDPAPP